MNSTLTGTDQFECPRRSNFAVTALGILPGPDTWRDLTKEFGGDAGPLTCSYCGSLNPDTFLEKVRAGWIVVPCDGPHNAYLDKPLTTEELEYVKANSAEWKAMRRIKIGQGLSEDEATVAADAEWMQHEAPLVAGRTVGKLYFAHLSVEQQNEFVRLYNSKAMRVGFPGHLYALSSFVRRAGVLR